MRYLIMPYDTGLGEKALVEVDTEDPIIENNLGIITKYTFTIKRIICYTGKYSPILCKYSTYFTKGYEDKPYRIWFDANSDEEAELIYEMRSLGG